MTRPTHLTPWSPRRARAFLRRAADRLASGRGLSDRSLGRLAQLLEEQSAATPTAFRRALARAGWSRGRIDRALAEVRHGRAKAVALQTAWRCAVAIDRLERNWGPALLFAIVGLAFVSPLLAAACFTLTILARRWVRRGGEW